MSPLLISRSPDLQRLRDDGYDVRVVEGFLIIGSVPYVNAARKVKRGALVSTLTLAGDVTAPPDTHLVYFSGEYPCDQDGRPIEKMRHESRTQQLHPQIEVQHSFSSKPQAGYPDYYAKMVTYAAILSGPAEGLEPGTTAQVHPMIDPTNEQGVFNYRDTASSRAGIADVNHKLAVPKVAIVGLGGTGSYVFDLVAKTPVNEIHLFDKDEFSQHNAFRCPGAPSLEDLRRRPSKVAYLAEQYGRLRKGIVPHEQMLGPKTVEALDQMAFVFVCVDNPMAKKPIVERLLLQRIPFIDVGMGIYRTDNSLAGILRVTTATAERHEHVSSGRCVSFAVATGNDEYARNIQVADLNALNAALAVVKWKKLCGFYLDLDREHQSLFTIDGNDLQNEERG